MSLVLNKILFFFFFFILQTSLYANRMIFVYPGGEGTAAQAQNLLNQFFEEIKNQGGPALSGEYYNDEKKAFATIKKGKADFAIVSLDFYQTHSDLLEKVLSTHPLESSSSSEVYTLLSNEEKISQVYTTRNFSENFLKGIFKEKWPEAPLVKSNSLFQSLKSLGNKEIQGAILLDSYEMASFKNLNFDWKKNLKPTASAQTEGSPFVKIKKSSQETQKIKEALLKLHQSESGKEILEELRLKSFGLVK